jgi:hypothetical protein
MVGLIRFILFFFVFLSYGQEHILIGDSQTYYLSKYTKQIKQIKKLRHHKLHNEYQKKMEIKGEITHHNIPCLFDDEETTETTEIVKKVQNAVQNKKRVTFDISTSIWSLDELI